MNKIKLHYILAVLFGLALFACEPESEIEPASNSNDLGSETENGISENGSEVICAEPVTWDLRLSEADEDIVGNVMISNDDMYLYVTVYSESGFDARSFVNPDVFLFVDTDLNNLPTNSFNYPDLDPELFDYSVNLDESMEYTFEVPLNEINGYQGDCGIGEFYIYVGARHSSTFVASAGSILNYDGSAPWWYDTYTPQCCEVTEERCETAFVKFDNNGMGYVFASNDKANPEGYPSINISNQRWGWAGKFSEDGRYEYDIWGAAGLNDTDNGALVGTATIEIDGDMVTVTYNLSGSFSMDVVHIYVSNSVPTTTAPGQFGWTVEFEESQTTYSNTFQVDGESDIWVIGHAEVCGPYPPEDDDEEDVE